MDTVVRQQPPNIIFDVKLMLMLKTKNFSFVYVLKSAQRNIETSPVIEAIFLQFSSPEKNIKKRNFEILKISAY